MSDKCAVVSIRLGTARDFNTRWLRGWLQLMNVPFQVHRKFWEWAAIANVLDYYGLLKPGKFGLGFGVGTEPLACLFGSLGARILATDLPVEDVHSALWTPTDKDGRNQHAAQKEALWREGICPKEVFDTNITFSPVDMTAIPESYNGQFDFVWSSSSLEHLGTIAAGQKFLHDTLKCLRPGGLSIHTTEFNADSNLFTLDSSDVVVFRKRDFEQLVRDVLAPGGVLEANWSTGSEAADFDVDEAPYRPEPHLKLRLGGVTIMSALVVLVKD